MSFILFEPQFPHPLKWDNTPVILVVLRRLSKRRLSTEKGACSPLGAILPATQAGLSVLCSAPNSIRVRTSWGNQDGKLQCRMFKPPIRWFRLFQSAFPFQCYQPLFQFSANKDWVSCKLTQSRHCLPGDRVRAHRLRVQSHKTAPHFGCLSQIQVRPCGSDPPAVDEKFPWPSPWVQVIC